MYNFRLPFMQPHFFNSNNFYKKNYYNNIKCENTMPFMDKSLSPKPSPPKALPPPQSSEILFEIFGVKIFFDDVLIICILLFLYQEGIQDEYLFISLILLLLS